MTGLGFNTELFDQLQAWLATPLSQNNPAITWGVLIAIIIVLILIAKVIDGGDKK